MGRAGRQIHVPGFGGATYVLVGRMGGARYMIDRALKHVLNMKPAHMYTG